MMIYNINNKVYLISFFFFALLETLLCSGIIYGWASMVVVLKMDHFYLDLCREWYKEHNKTFPNMIRSYDGLKNSLMTEELPGCPKQDDMLNLIFTVASFCLCGIKFPAGIFVDKYGPKLTRMVGGVVYLAASLGLGFLTLGYENVLFAVFPAIAMGGSLLVVSVYQVSNILYRESRSHVLCILHGAFDSSAVVLLIFKLIHGKYIKLEYIMSVYSGITFVFVFFGTLILIPPLSVLFDWSSSECEISVKIHKHTSAGPDFVVRSLVLKNGGTGFVGSASNHSCSTPLPVSPVPRCPSTPYNEYNAYDSDDEEDILYDEKTPLMPSSYSKSSIFPRGSVLRSVFTPLYMLELIFLVTFQLKLWYFVGSLPHYLERLTKNNQDQVSYYIDLFGYIQFGGILVTPFIGLVFGKETQSVPGISPAERRINELRGCITPFAITNLLCMTFCILSLFDKIYLQIPSFILYTTVRGFLYANHGTYMGRAFPASQFGTLYGLGIFLGGTFGIMQYVLFNLTNKTFNGDPFWTNIILLILVAVGNIHPIYLWYYCRRETIKIKNRSFSTQENINAPN